MDEPTFDRDGYPTEETLERIRTWPFEKMTDLHAAMDFAGRAWSYPNYWEKQGPDVAEGDHFASVRYVFSTGGWSGNESIVSAMEGNTMLQMVGAWSWRRGGHYEYRFPLDRDG